MSSAAPIEPSSPTEELFERYHRGWETRNPEMIASLHSQDTIFWLHDGSDPVRGRDALRAHCKELFARFDFSPAMGRRLYGENHWVFEWTMVLQLAEPGGSSFTAHVEMLDVVSVNADGEVTRKDVYVNGKQLQSAFSRAGIER